MEYVKRKSEVTDPISRIGSDDIHMHPDERKNLSRLGTRILDDKVAPVGLIGDMVDNEWTATGGGAEREEAIKNVLHHPVLLWDQLRWVVLHVLGLPNQLSQQSYKTLLVQITEGFLHRRSHGSV